MGESEHAKEDDAKISPDETRHLLIAALKIISKDRASRMKQQSNLVKNVILTDSPPTLAINHVPLPLTSSPVNLVSMAISSDATTENDEISKEIDSRRANLRRYVRVATNPYTGVLHYVNYPVYYPVYG